MFFFRFSKQKLLITTFQTPDTRHEENWMWIGLFAYNMLFHSRNLAKSKLRPWDSQKVETFKSLSPTMVQRDYLRIISEFETPANDPKPRGKSPGRLQGTKIPPRIPYPVIRKADKQAA